MAGDVRPAMGRVAWEKGNVGLDHDCRAFGVVVKRRSSLLVLDRVERMCTVNTLAVGGTDTKFEDAAQAWP